MPTNTPIVPADPVIAAYDELLRASYRFAIAFGMFEKPENLDPIAAGYWEGYEESRAAYEKALAPREIHRPADLDEQLIGREQ